MEIRGNGLRRRLTKHDIVKYYSHSPKRVVLEEGVQCTPDVHPDLLCSSSINWYVLVLVVVIDDNMTITTNNIDRPSMSWDWIKKVLSSANVLPLVDLSMSKTFTKIACWLKWTKNLSTCRLHLTVLILTILLALQFVLKNQLICLMIDICEQLISANFAHIAWRWNRQLSLSPNYTTALLCTA